MSYWLSPRSSGCSGRVDHDSPVYGWPSRTQIPHGHQRRQREDSCHDQDLRDTWQENLQERAAGSAGRRRGTLDKEAVKENITNTLGQMRQCFLDFCHFASISYRTLTLTVTKRAVCVTSWCRSPWRRSRRLQRRWVMLLPWWFHHARLPFFLQALFWTRWPF